MHFWARGYCVSTVGFDEETIKRYMREQEKLEKEQLDFNGISPRVRKVCSGFPCLAIHIVLAETLFWIGLNSTVVYPGARLKGRTLGCGQIPGNISAVLEFPEIVISAVKLVISFVGQGEVVPGGRGTPMHSCVSFDFLITLFSKIMDVVSQFCNSNRNTFSRKWGTSINK